MSKKKGGHHGGAWKVAYADFVTAMMALFLVLWIVSQDDEILVFTSEYFRNPFNAPLEQSTGILPKDTNDTAAFEQQDDREAMNLVDIALLNSLARDIFRLLDVREDELEPSSVDIKVATDGMHITLFHKPSFPLFNGQSAELTEWGDFVLQNLAWVVERHSFRVRIDAHTYYSDADLGSENYSLWELTADQANAARRSLVHYAVDPTMVERVTGFADTVPLKGEPAESEKNQRLEISFVVE